MAVASLTVTEQYALLGVLQNSFKEFTEMYTANGGYAVNFARFKAQADLWRAGLTAAGYTALATPTAIAQEGDIESRFMSLSEHCAKTLYVLLTGTGSQSGISTSGPTLDAAVAQMITAYNTMCGLS